jgi:hypothetical protein
VIDLYHVDRYDSRRAQARPGLWYVHQITICLPSHLSSAPSSARNKQADILEDISAGRYKSAESAVTRHLKKNPKSQAALTAKFVLNERQGASEATYLKSLKDARQGPLNPRNLWWMTNSLRNLKRRKPSHTLMSL